MLYLFDMDGTLISSYMDAPGRDYDAWEVLPGRRERLERLDQLGDTIAVVTNQGGVAFGHVTEQQAWTKAYNAVLAVGLRPDYVRVYACMHDVRGRPPYNDPVSAARRKPSGAMLREAMADYPAAAALGVLFVGDRPEDVAAAQDAGVSFQWAHIFFKDAA